MEKQSKFLNFKRKLMKMFLKTVFKVKDGTKNALLEAKSVSTNKNFILGFRRISLGVVIMLLSFTLLAIFGCLPKASAAANLIQQQSDFKTFDSCWYSLTPSTTAMTSATVNNGYTKYCYSLVNDDTNLDTSSYQYIINENDEVYVFEYYTWVENNANDTQKMAVYSETGLKETQINGQTMYVLSSGSNNYAFEKIDDYMYYRLYRFLPDWKNSGKIYYSQEEKTFSDNEYYGYKLLNDDIYKVYKDLNVSTEYVFDIESENVVFYQNVTIDPDTGDYLYNSTDGTVDTSEKQVINRNDINQATYVVEKMGNAYDVKDSNGKEKGQDGFSTNMYYKGNFLYIYKQGIKTGDTTVDAFEIYKIISDDYTEIDEDKFNINSGYSLITFKNDTKETIAEAVRYYNLYEISYKVTQATNNDTLSDVTDSYISENQSVNSVYTKNNNGVPTGYKITYDYEIYLRNAYDYKITYTLQNFNYVIERTTTTTQKMYILNKISSNTHLDSLNGYTELSKYTNATELSDLEKYSNNQKFYSFIKTTYKATNTWTYPTKSAEPIYGNDSNNQEEKLISESFASTSASDLYSKTSYSGEKKTLTSFSKNSVGTVTACEETKDSLYNVNETYYSNKQNAYNYTDIDYTLTKQNNTYYGSIPNIPFYAEKDRTYVYANSSTPEKFGQTINFSYNSGTTWLYLPGNPTYNQIYSGCWHTNDYVSSYFYNYGRTGEKNKLTDYVNFYYNGMTLEATSTKSKAEVFDHSHADNFQNSYHGYAYVGVPYQTSGTNNASYMKEYFNDGDVAVIKTSNDNDTIHIKSYDSSSSRIDEPCDLTRLQNTTFYVYIPIVYYCDWSNPTSGTDGGDDDEVFRYYGYYRYAFTVSSVNTKIVSTYYEVNKASSRTYDTTTQQSTNTDVFFYAGQAEYQTVTQTIRTLNYSQYYYSGDKWKIKSEEVTYYVKNQYKYGGGKLLSQSVEYFNLGTEYSKINFDGELDSDANDFELTDEQRSGMKAQIESLASGNEFNETTTNPLYYMSATVNSDGTIYIKFSYKIYYYIYYKDGKTVCKCNEVKSTYEQSDKIERKGTDAERINQISYYDVYQLSINSPTPVVERETLVGGTASYVDLTEFSVAPEDNTIINVRSSSNGYTKMFTIKEYTRKKIITGSSDTEDTVTYYSNSSNPEECLINGKYNVYNDDGSLVELNKFTTDADGKSKYYLASKVETNTDSKLWKKTLVLDDIKKNSANISLDGNDWKKYYDHSLDANYDEYYKNVVNKYKNGVTDDMYLSVKTNCVITEKYYSVQVTTYTTRKEKNEKVIFNYGTSSDNFGLSEVKISSYYDDIVYDKYGKVTSGTWKGNNPILPTSYNLFNDIEFYHSGINTEYYKRVTTNNGIVYCTLKNEVTVNLQDIIQKDLERQISLGLINNADTYKTYYLSYYIDGTKHTKTINVRLNYLYIDLATISIGKNSEYTLSKIMLSDDANREYSQYVEIGVENYNEKKIAHKIQNDIAWYKTSETYTAYISNLDELITKNGDWNNNVDVKYTVNTGDRNYTFTYTNGEKKHTTDNEYYFDDKTSRLVWDEVNNNFAYILNRKINVELEEEYGNDYLNITKNKDWNAPTYYFDNLKYQETVTNNKYAVKKYGTACSDYGKDSYVSNDSIIGKIALLNAINYNLNDVYIIENKGTLTFKLVQVSDVKNYAYEMYYDNNKSTEDDGYTFTYNNSGFEMTDAISYELKKDENGNPVKDSNGNYVYDEIKRNSLVINTDGTLDNLVNSGLSKYIGSSVKTPSKSTPTIRDNNIVKHLYEKGTNLTIDGSIVDNTGANTNETDVNTNIDYNNYEYSSSVYQEISKSYEKDYKNYLMFLNSTVDYNQTYNNYTNAFYKDSNGNIYRLKNENSVIKSDYSSINSISRYKKYEISGRWVKADSLNVGNSAIQGSSFKPKSTDISYSNFLSAEYNISKNYGAYLGVVKTKDGTSAYEGKLIGQNIAMGAVSTENSLNTSYYFDYYTVKDNNVQITNNGITGNYLNSSYYSDLMLEKNQNYYHDDSLNEDIFCNRLLVKKEKVKLYSITKKIEYNLQYVVEEANVDKLATLDMRYQYQSSNFFTQLKNSQLPIYIKGDDLSSHFEVTGARYSVNYDLKTYIIANSSVNIYNMAVASTKEQGILKPGITTIDNTQYIETIAYRDGVYKLGNIIGNESMFIDFAKYAENLKTKIADAIWNADSKDILELIKTLQKVEEMNLFTSTLYSVSINLNGLLSLGNDIWRLVSSYDKLKNSIVIEENGTTLSNLTKNSDYIRIGKACYYRVSTTDKYWSYRGVDVTLQNEDASNFDASGQYFKSLFTKVNPSGFVNILGSVYSSYFSSGLNLNSESKHQLAYATYSPLITSNHYVTGKDKEARNYISEVYLADILNGLDGADKVNQYFVQVEIGLTNSDTYIIYDLPLADVDMSYVTESFKSAKHKSARGIRFYNLSASKDGLRFLPSDDPGYFINTTAHGWRDYLLSCNVTNPDNMKIAYGYALSNSGKPIVEQQSTIDTSELKSLNINAGEKGSTYAALSDNPDNLYSKLGQNYISEHNLNSITSDTSNYMYVSNNGVPGDSLVNTITTLKDKSSGNGTSTLSVVQKPNNKEESYYVLNYTQYKTEMVLFGDYDKWLGNVEQYVVDALKITKHTIKAVFKFLTGKKEEAKDEYSNANSTNHLVMQFYQLPTFSEEIDASSKTTLSFDSEANNRGTDDVCSPIVDYNNYSYVLSDNNPTSNTSFNFKLSHEVLLNPSYNVYVGYTWGFALWTDDYIEGWQLKNGKYYYVNADRLGSGSYSGVDIVNIMLQTELNASVAFELPEGHTYHFKVYDGDAINNKKSGSNYFYTESALGNKHKDEIIISTSYNAVHNPYGQNKDKIDVSYSFYSGDAYLHDNDLITYDMLKFIYNTENVKTASYNNLGYVDYYDPILKQTFKFSSKVLMQKNLNTENISKIAFKLTGTNGYKQNISYNNYVEYRLYDIATREVVAEGKLNNNTSYLNNIILYDLTELDKAAISKYGGINESFVNNYLLKDKLVFSIRNTKDSEWLDADCKFTISWKPYYEETMTYLDLNQNGTYDDNEIETSYNVDALPISKESQTYVYAEYEHILSATNWAETLYTVTNNNQSSAVKDLVPFKVEDNWYQLCAYRNGEAHIIK